MTLRALGLHNNIKGGAMEILHDLFDLSGRVAIITSREVDDLPDFCQAIIGALQD